MAKKAKSTRTRQSRGKSNELPQIIVHGVQTGLLRFTSLIADLRDVHSVKAVYELLGLTGEEFGAALARTPEVGRKTPYSKTYISLLNSGAKKLHRTHLAGMARLLTDYIHRMTGDTLGVSVTRNSPLKIRVFKICETHGPFELKGNRKHCPLCQKG